MNKELLLKVKERILNEKIPVIMHTFFSVRTKDAKKNWKDSPPPISPQINWCSIDGHSGMTRIPSEEGIAEHGCRTAGCIAGHAIMEKFGGWPAKSLMKKYPSCVYQDDNKDWTIEFFSLGMMVLELTYSEADRLFDPTSWPNRFLIPYNWCMERRMYKKANQVVADRIDYFLSTGK